MEWKRCGEPKQNLLARCTVLSRSMNVLQWTALSWTNCLERHMNTAPGSTFQASTRLQVGVIPRVLAQLATSACNKALRKRQAMSSAKSRSTEILKLPLTLWNEPWETGSSNSTRPFLCTVQESPATASFAHWSSRNLQDLSELMTLRSSFRRNA